MMRTPSLRRRLVGFGVFVVFVVLVTTNGLLYVVFRAQLLKQLGDVLDQRAAIVGFEAANRSPEQLASRLTELGIAASIRSADGRIYTAQPPSPAPGNGLPTAFGVPPGEVATRVVPLGDGSSVTVFARRSGIDEAVRKLLLLEVAALVVASSLAAVLFIRTSTVILRPLRDIAESARRTSAGHRGERLHPDRADTTLGELAAAYDRMLDGLETAIREANDAQAESERVYLNLRQTIETANGAFVAMDRSGRIVDWNTTAAATFGWSRSEAVGRVLADTILPVAERSAHAEGLRRFLQVGDSKTLGKTVERQALHRDGRLIPVEVATWVTYVGDEPTFNAFLYDISERQEGQKAIARLAAIVESAQEAIYTTTLSGLIMTWNTEAERMYQFSAEEMIGRPATIIVPPDRMEEHEAVLDRVRRGEPVQRSETVRRRKDGCELDVGETVSPVYDAEGAVCAAATIARDITERHRMATQLASTMCALESALEDARRSEERTRRFLADAAHQLRTPMAGIRACAETLLLTSPGEDADRLLAALVHETSRTGTLINSLLRLAQADQSPVLTAEPADVVALCQMQIDDAQAVSPRLQFGLHVVNPPEGHPEVDRDALKEIMANLLDNAQRHAATRIDVFVSASQTELYVSVEDDGPGVPAHAIPRIFDRFVSLDGKGGTGLGLPIAQALARAQGGDLTYEGNAFRITVPLNTSKQG